MSSRGTSWGFTLLEVMLSMAIVALVMTVIYASFSSAGNNISQAELIREETDIARALLSRLSADISNAYVKQGMNTTIFFSGKEEVLGELGTANQTIRHDSITMTTLTNWPRPDSKETELWEVGYFFKEDPESNGYRLYRREKRELSKDIPPLEGGVEYDITDRVESLQYRFLEGSTWSDNGWDKRTQLPRAVEIVLVLDTGKVYSTRVDVGNI